MAATEVLIVGAGLAGLSAALHCTRPFILVEANDGPGGAARSITAPCGSVYDFTGHLLHLRRPQTRALVMDLLPDAFAEVERRAGIFMHDTFLPYPFQANFHPLPREVVRDCLLGFIRAWRAEEIPDPNHADFRTWALATLGEGICRHFFFPYNEKLYRTPAAQMTADWVGWSVPQPSLESVVEGALGAEQHWSGYNAKFLYPKQGGIEVLPRAMAARIPGIRYGARIVSLDLDRRVAVLQSGEEIAFERCISTMPLPVLLRLLRGAGAEAAHSWADRLRWTAVYNLNFTLSAPPPWDWQWLYLPEPQRRCYRIGVASNISPALAPAGKCTVYTEVACTPDELLIEPRLRAEIRADLRAVGLLRDGVEIVDETPVRIDPAYVVHDAWRRDHLPQIHAWLRQHAILSTGRWGAWEYGGMEDAMAQGMTAIQSAAQF